MKIREPVITDDGTIIDPDDDIKLVKHSKVYEFIYDTYCKYYKRIYRYKYD